MTEDYTDKIKELRVIVNAEQEKFEKNAITVYKNVEDIK